MTTRSPSLDLARLFEAVDSAPPIAGVEVIADALASEVGALEVSFLIADFTGQALVRLSHIAHKGTEGTISRERSEKVTLLDTPHGEAISRQEIVTQEERGLTWLFAPVSSRGEAVGLLEMCFRERPDRAAISCVAGAAHALAYVLIANRRYTDLFEWGQRSLPLSLEAEIQHRLLPGSYTCDASEFSLAGWLEPAGNVGGDTFDFSLERDVVHLSITDAMGHDLNAALLATVFIGASRNSRRRGCSLIEQGTVSDAALCHYSNGFAFVTGQLVRIGLTTGLATIINAGHSLPLLIRKNVAANISLLADPPFGVDKQLPYRVQEFQLEPGDRVVFLTDGMTDRNAESVDISEIMLRNQHLHPREAIQALTLEVSRACAGKLKDDATAMCFDWRGPDTVPPISYAASGRVPGSAL